MKTEYMDMNIKEEDKGHCGKQKVSSDFFLRILRLKSEF